MAQVKVGKTMDWVLGLDTFDQARKFNHTEIAAALQWASYLGSAMQAAQVLHAYTRSCRPTSWKPDRSRTPDHVVSYRVDPIVCVHPIM